MIGHGRYDSNKPKPKMLSVRTSPDASNKMIAVHAIADDEELLIGMVTPNILKIY